MTRALAHEVVGSVDGWEVLESLGAEASRAIAVGAARRRPFEESAEAVLSAFALHERLGPERLIEALAKARVLPAQLDPGTSFGEPPVTVHRGAGFVIDVYLWLAPHTAIHDHGFQGAFTLLSGSSARFEYAFDALASYDPGGALRTGELRLTSAELLRPGDVRRIERGTSSIHRVAHLARPTISIAIRTDESTRSPQFEYLPPSIAACSRRGLSETARRKVELARFLQRGGLAEPVAPSLLEGASHAEAFWILFELARNAKSAAAGVELLRGVDRTRWPWLDAFAEAMSFAERALVDLERLTDAGERLFAVLATGLADRATFVRMVADFVPEARFETQVLDWIRALSQKGLIGFGMNATAELALGAFLSGGDEEEAVRAIRARYPAVPEAAALRDVRHFLADMSEQALLWPFVPSDAAESPLRVERTRAMDSSESSALSR